MYSIVLVLNRVYITLIIIIIFLLFFYRCQKLEKECKSSDIIIFCSRFKDVLNHMTSCQTGMFCSVPYCFTSRQILCHWENCSLSDCLVCLSGFKKSPNQAQSSSPGECAICQVAVRCDNAISKAVKNLEKSKESAAETINL